MLLPYTTLTYYGPATAALIGEDSIGELTSATPRQWMRGGLNVLGLGDAPLLRPYRGRNAALTALGEGFLHGAGAKKRIRSGLSVFVSSLSQDDVTGAVLEAVVEGDITLKETLRLMLAYVAGNASGLDTNPAYKAMDGTTTRLAGTISGGTRTITTRNPE